MSSRLTSGRVLDLEYIIGVGSARQQRISKDVWLYTIGMPVCSRTGVRMQIEVDRLACGSLREITRSLHEQYSGDVVFVSGMHLAKQLYTGRRSLK